jgi:hypothetical protein
MGATGHYGVICGYNMDTVSLRLETQPAAGESFSRECGWSFILQLSFLQGFSHLSIMHLTLLTEINRYHLRIM